jgi:hypothetical protein
MKISKDYNEVFQRYHETTTKFDYFVAGITLAVLSFSVQATQHANLVYSRWLIVGSWVSFLASFIAGLWRMESSVEVRSRDVEVSSHDGEHPPREWIDHNSKLERGILFAYRTQKATLIIGLALYASFHILNYLSQN